MSDASVIGDLVARDRRGTESALYAASRDRTYSYFDLCNTAAKAGNVLRHVGVRPGDAVWIEPRPDPEAVLTFLGAVQLGAVVRFAGPHDVADGYLGRVGRAHSTDEGDGASAGETGATAGETEATVGPAAVVVHAAAESATRVPPGTSLVVYGDQPEGAEATHWESEVWSENPAAPPAPTDADDPAIRTADGSYTHRALLDAARRVTERGGIDEETSVVLRASTADPRAVAGLLAPLAARGEIVLPAGDRAVERSDLVAVGDDGLEDRRVPLDEIDLSPRH